MALAFTPSQLGGNSKGMQPMLHGHMDGGNDRALSRKYLSRAFGNMINRGLGTSPLLYKNNVLGPFKTAFNAGDVVTNKIILSMEDYRIKLEVIIYRVFK